MTEFRLDNSAARRLFLTRQGLGESGPADPSLDGLLALITRIGFVQVDSINTVERAHHMILRARRRSYRPEHLTALLERRRDLFEHWTHDAAVIPTAFFPYWRLRFERDQAALAARWRKARPEGFEAKINEMLEHIRREGPVLAREVGSEEAGRAGGWWDWKPSKTALEYLWRSGALAVAGREGFQKRFDLTERVIPAAARNAAVAPAETIDWACAGALDRLGFAAPGEISGFWGKVSAQEAAAWCARERERGRLVEILVESAAAGRDRKAYARPDIADALREAPPPPSGIRILSPFDPALRDRGRTERLFGFRYRIEVFVPASRREYGYYVFPVLEGDRLIGRIDMQRDRDADALAVRAFWPEHGVRLGKRREVRLEGELRRVARFAALPAVRFADGWRRPPR